jgi:serpin B
VFSPLSVTYALGLLNNGATDQTKQEINNVLGAGLNDNVINDFCRKMLTESWTLDEQTKVSIANTIFMNKDYELKPSFVEKANDYYDAKVQTRDFYDGQTLDAINEWANNCTNGMIKEILNEQTFDPSLVSYLLNAIYFKGTWANKFNKANTHEESFNGNYVVDMMHQQEEFNYIENDTYQAVILPYGNNSYSMTVFLPRENKTLDDVLNVLNSSNWKKHDGEYMVDLKLPRFEIDSDINLKNPLSELGMPSAFIYSPNGFENFCNVPTYIDLIKQSAKIKVDEEGTEAAAVTIIGYATSSIPREAKFHANRPFFYIISERSTGVIFFMGQYVGGSTSRPVQTTAISGQEKIMDKGKCINGNDVNGGWVYDLQGRKLSEGQGQLRKGLYIQGGKKFVKP